MSDTLNGKSFDKLARKLRPADYAEGRGLSPAGEKVSPLLHAADLMATYETKPEADASWQSTHSMPGTS